MQARKYSEPRIDAERYLYSASQQDLLAKVRELGQQVIGVHAKRIDQEGIYPFESMQALADSGLAVLAVPTAMGGWGAGYAGDVEMIPLILMELASWCSSTSQVFTLHNTGVQLVHALGSAKQQEFFFDEARAGHWFASFGSESGKDRFKLESELRQNKDGYVLNGTKIFATGSPGAKWAFWRSVLADTEGSQNERYVMPLVDLTSSGITIVDDWNGIGQRGTGSGQVLANNVHIPTEHLIGEPGSYGTVDSFFSAQFNIHFAAQFTGIAMGAYREAIAYVHERSRSWSTDGTASKDSPIVRVRLGECSARIAAARELVLQASRVLGTSYDQPELRETVQVAASQAKIIATKAALEVTSSLFQVMGARAATRDNNFDMYYRNARTLTLHDPVDKHLELLGQRELERYV
ncbi:acyl-CoA dehydrogenase family protein [Paenibacillus sp. FSL K6-1318]|uniref:acyl-CoA dehydrogenase family protein n=1 Tax=Paenibacillus sp. FSL K6-1318 TaxID=2975291 RepID=UPI0030EE6EEE